MENFDWRKMSKLTFPNGVNGTEYLRFEANGTWTASDKEQVCTMTNTNPANAVAVLNAKMHPVNDEDRWHMIDSLQEWIQRYKEFLTIYGDFPQWQSDSKDVRRGVERMEQEIKRLREIEFPQ